MNEALMRLLMVAQQQKQQPQNTSALGALMQLPTGHPLAGGYDANTFTPDQFMQFNMYGKNDWTRGT